MATPQGAVAKVFFRPETTYGQDSIGAGGATTGYLVYFDRASPRSAKTPLDFGEISGLSTDYSSFEEGGIDVGFEIEYAMRYYGAHFLLIGLAMGEMDTTGAGAPFTHTLLLRDTVYSASIKHQIPITNNSSFDQNGLSGNVINRMVLSHRAGDVMRARMEMLSAGLTYEETASTPPSAAGRTPTEALISWHHKDAPATAFGISIGGGPLTQINARSWELTLDNKLEPNFLIQNGRSGGQPQRADFREVRLRMEIEQNAGWRAFLTAYGDTPTGTTQDFAVTMRYVNPAVANETFKIDVSNCRTLDVQRNIETAGKLYQQVEMRAHFKTGSTNLWPEPLRIIAQNTVDLPYDEAPLNT